MLEEVIKNISKNKKQLLEILLDIETIDVAEEEIELSINALKNTHKYSDKKVEKVSSYLPMNLPLYSLVNSCIIPKLYCDFCYYRPSSEVLKQSKKIHSLLNLNLYSIFLFEGTREDFFREIVYTSNVVIFVGKPENASSVKKKLSENTMFLYFGVGQNPIVVADNANLDIAAKKIVDATMFNYGQDCAKPNIILCKKNKYNELKKYLLYYIKRNMNKKTTIKKLRTLIDVAELLSNDREYIDARWGSRF